MTGTRAVSMSMFRSEIGGRTTTLFQVDLAGTTRRRDPERLGVDICLFSPLTVIRSVVFGLLVQRRNNLHSQSFSIPAPGTRVPPRST